MKTIFYPKSIITIIAMLLITLNVFSQAPPTTIIPFLKYQEGTVIVPVTVTNFNGVGNISLRLNYDPMILEFQNVVDNPTILTAITTTSPDASGQFRLSYTGAIGVPGITLPDGTALFTLTFKIKPGVTGVITPITWSTLQKDCEYAPPSPGTFSPEITPGNLSTYFINGSVSIKPMPIITGPNTVCPGSAGNIYTTQAGMSNYTWNVSTGGTITAGASTNSITVTWPAAVSSHSVSVNYTDPTVGSMATIPTVYPVNVTNLISPTITGSNSVCFRTMGSVYITDPGMSNYTWAINGGTITSGGTSTSNIATVTWNTSGVQYISVNYTPNGGCPSIPTYYPVTVTPTVGIPTAISISAGNEPTCQLSNATTTTTYATASTDNIGFNWSISNSAAGTINSATGLMTWANGFTGTVDIQVTANGCNGPSIQVIRKVTIAPTVGIPTAISISAGIEPTCQLANTTTTTTYATTATDNTGFNWSISNIAAGSINPLTGVMTWTNGFVGMVDIQVTANGCNGPSQQLIRKVTITPTVGLPSAITISSGLEPTCQLVLATTTTTYSTTATNSTGFNWSISNPAAGTINPTTGLMTWAIGFSGSVNIQVTANGCNSPSLQVIRTVTLTPGVGIPSSITILAGTEPTCQLTNATTTTTYTSTAANSLSFSWTISNPAAGSIDPLTGVMRWSNGFSGTVDIQVKANGCSGSSLQIFRTVTVAPNVGTPTSITVSAGAEPTCQLTNAATTTSYSTTATNSVYLSWSISNPAAGIINTATGVMTWNNAFAGSVDIRVSANGCNGQSPQVIRTVTVTPTVGIPTAIIISAGTEPTCQLTDVTTITTYSTTATDNTGFIWSISNPAAGTINPITGVMLWTNGFTGSVDIQVMAYGCNGPSVMVSRTVGITPSVATPVFTLGLSSVRCPGAGTVLYDATAANSTSITYALDANSLASGNTINSTTGAMTFTAGWNGISTITATASGCNGSTSAYHTATVNPLPIPTIDGPASVCINSIENVYTTEPGMINYIWSVSTGGTITKGGTTNRNSATVTWNTSGPQTVRVIYANATGCNAASAALYPVNVNPTPSPTINGPLSACTTSTGNVYTTETGMSNYTWTVSTGGTIISGGTMTDNTVTVTWNTEGAQTVSINYLNGTGCSSTIPTVYDVIINPLPKPAISGPSSVCYNSTGNVYTTEVGMSNYAWNVSSGGTITAGGISNSVTITWNTQGAQNVSVNYTNGNGCTAASAVVYPVTVASLVSPSLNGSNSVCAGASEVVYTTETGMTQYNWNISSGGTITTGGTLTDNTVTVSWKTEGAQSITVDYIPSGGCASMPTVLPVTVNPIPTPAITGPSTICVNTSGNVYSTEAGMSHYTWKISTGGTITSGGTMTDNTVTIIWNTASAQTINVNYTNGSGCTATNSTPYNVTVNPLPKPAINGPSSVCFNSTSNVYTTEAGMSNYAWKVSSGGTIVAGGSSNTVTITWNTEGAQNVSVNYTNGNGCSAASEVVYPVTVASLVSPSLNGTNAVCAGTTGVVYTTESGMTQYNWNISSGGTITSGGTLTDNKVTVSWNTEGAQSVSVYYIPSGGCASIPTFLPVTVNPLPTPTIIGPTTICVSTSGNVYTTQVGMSNYTWTVSTGGTIISGGTMTDNTVTVTWNTEGAQTVSINYLNGSGCKATIPKVYNVMVNPLPKPAISGPSSVCFNSTGNVYTTEVGMSNYAWNVSAGGTITSGGTLTDNTVTITWNTQGAQNVSVNYTNGNGCSAASEVVYPVTVASLVSPSLNGSSAVCAGITGVVYTTESGMTQYNWNISSGGTITSGGTLKDNKVTVSWNTEGSQSVSVHYIPSGGCASIPTLLPVTVNPLPTPTIIGPATICVSTSGNVYTTQVGMSNYTWTVSTGGTIISGGTMTDNTVTVTWNTEGPQTVSVNYASVFGCLSINPVSFNVTVNSIPNPAGIITGSANVIYGASGVAYSIASIPNATSYTWSIPAGATIASGNGTNSITVNFAGNAIAGNITVHGNNDCGVGIASSPFVVAFKYLPAIPGNITGPETVCQSATGITYSVPLINNATGYTWTIPSGTTITSGDNTNSITINYGMNAVSGNVTVYGTNENGNGPVSSPLAVTTNPLPDSPIITVDAASGVILTSNATTSNQWYDDKGLIVGATNQTYTATHNGNFFVAVTGICTFDKSNSIIVTRVSINASDKQIFGVYPNPNNGGFWIEYKSSENKKLKMIQVLDLLGKPVYQLLQTTPTSDYKEWVNIKNHPIGVYILVLTTENNKLSRRLVITR